MSRDISKIEPPVGFAVPQEPGRILAASKAVLLPIRAPLIDPGEPLQYAYFITSGIASVVVELAEGGSTEVALIGREGLVGGLDLLGRAPASSRCFIQVEASAYRIPFAELQRFFLDSEEVRSRILEMVQQQSLTMAQIAACNKLHEAEARLARWLLMVQDRTQSKRCR